MVGGVTPNREVGKRGKEEKPHALVRALQRDRANKSHIYLYTHIICTYMYDYTMHVPPPPPPHTHTHTHIYHKELAPTDSRDWELQDWQSASWSPRRADSINSSLNLKAEDVPTQRQSSREEEFFLVRLLFYSGLQWIRRSPPH